MTAEARASQQPDRSNPSTPDTTDRTSRANAPWINFAVPQSGYADWRREYAGLKALEFAGVLTWQHRITRIRERCRDLFGHNGWRWRVIRTSNCYQLRDPKQANPSKSENPSGTSNQDILSLGPAAPCDPDSLLERTLARFGAVISARSALNKSGRTDEAAF